MKPWKAVLVAGILTGASLGASAAQASPAPETWRQPVASTFGHTDPAEVSVPMLRESTSYYLGTGGSLSERRP